ncbi:MULTISPECIES: hypothetical protein [unclassified Mesorhizobium]|uniref:hypothetical protein n=1 Tax=unclassified Mesorhizobium TaxID=325217 RepID=UPI00112C5478|nr:MULTISPECIES: hypothetical protein [unclassified Mesorhizobium]MBZ9983154.1 hypothetical protein [Mesorhizobium sp. BR-1-1-8]TPI53649.1 hypothetical protein FJW11_12715 [Mesorhizobium sp. B3-1-1]TPJ69234.1 hypothetical protein FJ462_09480 [Mesorhizobium sp. B2-6-7]TPJ86676.1 hypothetical protein FJ422_09775 [Mesorhizobium sp. B2-6-3]TPK02533.1 hypothetical protein FJ491_06615 [Mesorhizobium sp. B2-5-10]
MRKPASNRQGLGIAESAAMLLAVAVALLAVARSDSGMPGCAMTSAPVSSAAGPAGPAAGIDAADMLLHD